jgi:hypothetical protein
LGRVGDLVVLGPAAVSSTGWQWGRRQRTGGGGGDEEEGGNGGRGGSHRQRWMAARSYGGGMAAVGGAGLVGAFPTLVRQQWPWTAGVGRRRHQFWIYIVKKIHTRASISPRRGTDTQRIDLI